MKITSINELYKKLKEFRIPKNNKGDGRQNCFWEVTEKELKEAESKMEVNIPANLKKFYREVGYGHLVVNSAGIFTDHYLNIIVDLDRLVNFWKRTEVSFDYDPDLINHNELAFFDTGSFTYKVFRPLSNTPEAVFDPYDKKPIASNFDEFLINLYNNTTFYLNHEGEYD